MRLGVNIGYSGAALGMDLARLQEADRLGFHSVWSAEAYGSDAVSTIAWVAAQTTRIGVGTYLSGEKDAAAAAVPDALVDEVALCGPRERIKERLSRWTASGVTTMICGMGQREAVSAMAELVL